jgi:hypothetical protein
VCLHSFIEWQHCLLEHCMTWGPWYAFGGWGGGCLLLVSCHDDTTCAWLSTARGQGEWLLPCMTWELR